MNIRRSIPSLLLVLVVSLLTSRTTGAQTDIYIRGAGKLFPVALPQLCSESGAKDPAVQIPKIIARDLALSGFFEVISPEAYIETPGKCGAPETTAFSDWSVIGTEGLVKGTITSSAGGIKAQLYLLDVGRQKVVLGKEYEGDSEQVGRIAHRFANEIMRFFTGEPGVFGSQIAFSGRVGRFKELFVMDMDGSNVRQITNDRSLNVSSAWNRAGTQLIFTSYRNRVPDLFVIDPLSKRIRQITSNQALEIGTQFSNSGTRVVTSVTVTGDSDLVLMDPSGKIERALTRGNGAIDVSPVWSPDDSKIAFCSNRSGGPQIYTMNSDGTNAKRISFVSSNYCTSPSWSPKGNRIAFVCRADSGFQIFVANEDGSSPLQLTSAGDNEDPDWSPDGRYMVFATTFGRGGPFSLALMREDGSHIRQLTQSRGGDFDPAWGPIVP